MDLNNQEMQNLLQHNNVIIKYTNIFPNTDNPGYNTCVIFFKKDKIDYLLYADKVNSTTEISITETFDSFYLTKNCELNTNILAKDGIIFRIIQLTPPKEITMKDIEKAFGGPVKIIDK